MSHFLIFAYWFVLVTLVIGVMAGLFVGNYYLIRDRADKRNDWLFSALLITFSLTLLHNLLIHLGVIRMYPRLMFLPLYFTLSLGPLLFFFVKTKLYPRYRLKWTDAKHFFLPAGQFLYFIILFFQPVETKLKIGRNFYSPFYGGIEMLLYIGTFFAYHYFAYRFIRYKSALTRNMDPSAERLHLAWLKRMVKALSVLFFLNAAYILVDFLSYEALGINLHLLPGFEYIGSLSFASMLYWLSFNGWMMRKV